MYNLQGGFMLLQKTVKWWYLLHRFTYSTITYIEQSMYEIKIKIVFQNWLVIWFCPCVLLTKDFKTLVAWSIILTLIIFHINHLISLRTLPNTDPIIGLTNEKIFKSSRKACLPTLIQPQPLYLTNWWIYTVEESCVNRWEPGHHAPQ